MLSRPLGLALVAAGCIGAAGIGAYVAVRHNAADLGAPASGRVSAPRSDAAAPQGGGVAETEAIVADDRGSATAASSGAATPGAKSTEPKKPVKPESRAKPAEVARAGTPAAASSAPPDPSWTGLDRPWPSRPSEPAPETTVPPVGAVLPPEPLEPPPPQYEELVVSADSVIGLQIENSVSTETAHLEDRVEARVTRDVTVAGRVAVPAGTRVLGAVTLVERGGKFKERARLGVRFHTLVMADASRLPIQTESIFREGEPPSQESVAKIGGGAAAGAILGAILGGGKGAIIGGATGAAGGTAATAAGDRKPATLRSGAIVTVRLTAPVTVTVER